MSSTAGAEARRPRKARSQPNRKPGSDTASSESVHQLALAAARAARDKKAENVILLDLSGQSAVCDYFVIASGNSETQVKAIADHVAETLDAAGHRVWHVEGYRAQRWILLDFVDVVVHVFHRDTREVYQLERLWADARKETPADE